MVKFVHKHLILQTQTKQSLLSNICDIAVSKATMSKHRNIFHLFLILAFLLIFDASSKRPKGYLVKKNSGKTYLVLPNKDKSAISTKRRQNMSTSRLTVLAVHRQLNR